MTSAKNKTLSSHMALTLGQIYADGFAKFRRFFFPKKDQTGLHPFSKISK